MAEIYIDPTSPTNGTGTELDPKNTWAGLSWASDTIYRQKRGTTFSAAVTVGASGANPSAPIVLSHYGSDSAAPIIAVANTASCVNIAARSHIRIEGLSLDARASTGHGVLLSGAGGSNIKVQDTTIMAAPGGTSGSCVTLAAAASAAFSEIEVLDCALSGGLSGVRYAGTVNGLTHSGLRVIGGSVVDTTDEAIRFTVESATTTSTINGVVVRGVYIRRAGKKAVFVRGAYELAEGATPPATWGLLCIVENNDIADCGSITQSGAVEVNNVDGVQYLSNRMRNCGTFGALLQGLRRKNIVVAWNDLAEAVAANGIDGHGIFIDRFDNGARVFSNRIKDCPGVGGVQNSGSGIAVWMAENAVIRNNLVLRCKSGLDVGGNSDKSTSGIFAHNNTFADIETNGYQGDNDGVGMASDALDLRNNVFVRCATAINVRGRTLTTCDYNAFEECGALYAGGQSAGANDIDGGLMLSDAAIPLFGSPLLTSGADLGYLRDIRRNKGRSYIGAYAPPLPRPQASARPAASAREAST